MTFDAIGDPKRFATASKSLAPALTEGIASSHQSYLASQSKRPWLAAGLSLVIPGAGQAYAGSWSGAAVALVLNAALIGGTIELGRRRLFFSASVTGLAASVFYVGNILNAADLARRWNSVAARPYLEEMERLLVPETQGFE